MSGDDLFDDAVARAMLGWPGDQRPAVDPAVRARLLESSHREHRFPDLVSLIARDADLPAVCAADLLCAVDDPSRWSPGPAPGVTLLHFDGGPKTADAITGFVRVEPGHFFPEHDHAGVEIGVVLQGALRDTATGAVHERGARVVTHPGTAHALEVVSRAPAIYLAIAHVGVIVGGQLIGPDDARF
ncbi:MAG: cupin domain-containing protein [Myxococcales bacterium]|nr:cupin domain-containing protein [Myxococcales bacterium]